MHEFKWLSWVLFGLLGLMITETGWQKNICHVRPTYINGVSIINSSQYNTVQFIIASKILSTPFYNFNIITFMRVEFSAGFIVLDYFTFNLVYLINWLLTLKDKSGYILYFSNNLHTLPTVVNTH